MKNFLFFAFPFLPQNAHLKGWIQSGRIPLPTSYQLPIISYRGRSWLGVGRGLVTDCHEVSVMSFFGAHEVDM